MTTIAKARRAAKAAATEEARAKTRLLSRREVMDITGVSYPTLWSWMRQGKFPRARKLGNLKVAWVESEITGWIHDLPTKKLKGDAEKVAS
jgi:prophage regulatory protein